MKKFLLSSLGCFLFTLAFSQNNAPIAVTDTIETISQVSIDIDALANDYDPDGDGIHLKSWIHNFFGDVDTANGKFRYTSETYYGYDHIDYYIQDNGSPPLTSGLGRVLIHIAKNPDVPVANPDTFDLLELIPEILDLLINDSDPNGDELKISKVTSKHACNVIIHEDSLMVTVIPGFSNDMEASFNYELGESNTPGALVSDRTEVFIRLVPNPDVPVAIPDTVYTTGGTETIIPILANDYDPQGDPIEISSFTQPNHGNVTQSANNLLYIPPVSYKGSTAFSYKIQEVLDSSIYSKSVKVILNVAKNPDCPVGVPDQASGITYQPMLIDVLSNDYDPNGDPLQIYDIESEETVSISGNQISFTSWPTITGHDTLYYRVGQSNHFQYYSEWTPVYIELEPNPNLPVAVADSAETNSGFSVYIAPLKNDINNASDSLTMYYISPHTQKGRAEVISDSLVLYRAYSNSSGQDTLKYLIRDKQDPNLRVQGNIYIRINNYHFFDSLVVNNINAGVNADGMLFGDIDQIPGEGLKGEFYPHFKYPNGTDKNTIFLSNLWVGGISDDDSLHFAGERYRQIGADFQPGPVSDLYDSNFAYKYWKLWKLNKQDVEYHRNNWWKQGYQPLQDIASWPGNGDVTLGQAVQLAPYADFNQDGKYDPMDGDYPLIRGDQTIFFICNDDQIHTESLGNRLKIEIHGMVYGFDAPDDSVLSNTVFVHYDLINRSDKTYYNIYAGVYTELDIGNFFDDYIGSDVNRGSYYGFNGDDFDEDMEEDYYSSQGYGEFPPAQSVTVLAGPFMDPDGLDNPAGGCDFSVNGCNFGNGASDDERFGLSRFMYFTVTGFGPTPFADDFYNMMNGFWMDNSPCSYGGYGHYFQDSQCVGPACNFMFPGDSDPLNWGTGCVFPNGGFNQNGKYWTDSTISYPGDRRGLGIMGPFTFEPGQVQEIELAYCVANGWDGPVSSVVQLMENIDSLRSRVQNGEIIVPNNSLGLNENKTTHNQLKLYPNPAGNTITIQLPANILVGSEFIIYDIMGGVELSGRIISGPQFTVNINNLEPGLYFVKVNSKKETLSAKFIRY